MDIRGIRDEISTAFARDLRDGTVDIESDQSSVALDGGNWSLTVHRDGVVSLGLPMNDPNYYDDDLDVFLENVFSLGVEESLATVDRILGGVLVDGLRKSGESWSEAFAERISLMRA